MTTPYEDAPWAMHEFGTVALGNAKRTKRLVQLATVLGAKPDASFPEACGDDAAMLKAVYRFFDNAAIAPDTMLALHLKATYSRCAQVPLVLAVNDTTYLDYTHHPYTEDMGPLATVQQQGLLAHTTLTITPERVPLGLLSQQVWARDPATYAQKERQKHRPVEEKESFKWLKSLEATNAAAFACPETHFVAVGDRESDVYELFAHPREPNVDLLVRAAQNRGVDHPDRVLWSAMETAPRVATITVHVPPRQNHPARDATLTVRFRAMTLRPPRRPAAQPALPPVAVWVVWAHEACPPTGEESVEWMVVTTCPVLDTEGALRCLEWYAVRWGIEVWHKVLKSGCKIEARQLETAARLKRCLSLYSVIAWRVLYAVMLAREVPDVPCTVVLDYAEWHALWCTIKNTATMPPTPPSLRDAVRWIARLGGFQARKGDGEPGVTVLWRGFQHLADLTRMYRILRPRR